MTSFSSLFLCLLFFFFSSRRRHTRLQGDWSSDVCSSDLTRIRVLNVHVAIGCGDVTLAALRFCFQIRDSSLARRKTNLLSGNDAGAWAAKRSKKRRQKKKKTGREKNPYTGMTIRAEHAVNENSWIA